MTDSQSIVTVGPDRSYTPYGLDNYPHFGVPTVGSIATSLGGGVMNRMIQDYTPSGRLLLGTTLTIGTGIYDIQQSYQYGNSLDVAAQSAGLGAALAGGISGGMIGARAGALFGALFGPAGAAIGGGVGLILGGAYGAYKAEDVVQALIYEIANSIHMTPEEKKSYLEKIAKEQNILNYGYYDEDDDFIYTGQRVQCFPAGTPITLASGETVSIEDIAIDDHVAAVHNFSQETVIDAPLSAGTVSRLYTNLTGDFVELNFIDPATGKQTTLTSTLGHVFLDENGKWRQIGNMIVDANNIVPFTGSKIAEATIASKLTAMNLSQNAGANDNYYPAQTPQAQT